MKVLLVEDDLFFGQLIVEYLADNGVETVLASSAQEALSYDLGDYECAIIDVMLPNDPADSGIPIEETRGGYLAGIAVGRHFRKRNSTFPLIFISSEASSGEARQWANAQGHPFIYKYEHRSR